MLESAMDKRRIFEIYLNVAEWGENVFGPKRRHATTRLDAAALEPEQAARLAACFRAHATRPQPRFTLFGELQREHTGADVRRTGPVAFRDYDCWSVRRESTARTSIPASKRRPATKNPPVASIARRWLPSVIQVTEP